ncbi:MAG: AAA family ATPase [Candidatus Buchananbacteria bacterium]|nr:AAA family ATPase [Candidatus Buchananbacteria bacterium]
MKKYQLQKQQACFDNFKIDYQNELNKEQLDVVLNGEGPCLVLAGAGSGKTRTLVYRVAYLIEKGINPKNILLVTFTNKAAKEMLNRVEFLLKCQPKGLWGGTFHHIGNIILRRYAKVLGYNNKFTILDQEDAKTLLKAVMGELNLNYKDKYFPKADIIQNVISFSLNSQKPISQVIEGKYNYLDPKLIPIIETINKAYQKKKLKTNVMDFDDLLINWLKLLKKNKTIKNKLASQFKYILVDEYQDTNRIQAEIIYELGSMHKNILVVGDDCQSIYSFRAADINNILDFPKKLKKTKVFKIETNYRSSPEILDLANNSIANNFNQYPKALNTIIEHKQKPALVALRDSEQQAQFIAQRILELQDEGVSLDDMAILFRSSFQVMELELELNKRNIPYQMRGGMKFFEQAHIKDIVAYLKIINNWQDELSWKRVLLLYEGIGPANAQMIWQEISKLKTLKSAVEQLSRIPASVKVIRSLEKLNQLFKFLLEQNQDFIATAIKQILKADYQDYLKTNFENAKDRLEDLNQLANFALQYEKLEDFLSDVTLSEGFKGETVEQYQAGSSEILILSTIHQAKGLEWKYLFVIGLVEGQFPHYKIYDHPEEIEEERRLFYVAVTRAKDELYLTYPIISFSFSTGQNINKPSSFLQELDDQLFEPWQVNEENEVEYDNDDEQQLVEGEFLQTVHYDDL